MESLSKLYGMFNNSVEFLAVSLLLAGASLAVASWKRSAGYFLASVVTGTVVGYVTSQTPLISEFSHMLAAAGAGLGAATLAYIGDKDVLRILKEYLAIRKDPNTDNTETLHVTGSGRIDPKKVNKH